MNADHPSRQAGSRRAYGRCFGQDLMRGEHVVGRPKDLPDSRCGKQRWASSPKALANLTERVALGRALTDTSLKIAEAGTGTSIFDPVLCELAYRWFCPPAGIVLDPFAGGSVRGIVASRLGRRYIGLDLRPEQIAANRKQAEAICKDPVPEWIEADARNVADACAGKAVDFVFSCPPYADLERYSDDPRDLSTLDYPQFLEAYRGIVAACCSLLKRDRFACFVVGDIRDKEGFYRGFPWHTVQAFEQAGLHLYNEAVLVTAAGSLPLRIGRQFTGYRKLGKTHQNVLIFCKGDPRRAVAAIGPVEFGAGEPQQSSSQ